MEGTAPDAPVEDHHGGEINKDHGHQPHGKHIKTGLIHTDFIRYSAEGVEEACEQGKANGLTSEPDTPEPNPLSTKFELDTVSAHRRNDDARDDLDGKTIPEEQVGPEGDEDGCECGEGIAQGKVPFFGSIGPCSGKMVRCEKGGRKGGEKQDRRFNFEKPGYH